MSTNDPTSPGQGLTCDVVVIGSGPAGSMAALQLARRKVDVLMIEKASFPRFQIGESILPYTMEMLQDLGLDHELAHVPHIVKRGAEFAMGHDLRTTLYPFNTSLSGRATGAFNIARADFDQMLQNAASKEGARRETGHITQVDHLADDQVKLTMADGRQVSARYMIDASGQATLLARHFKQRVAATESHLRKIAYFAHFTDVRRLKGDNEGMITIVMCQEGWFWIIPLDATNTSVGMVIDATAAAQVKLPATEMLAWGLARCPLMARRMKEARCTSANYTRADFSYDCKPYAGPGFFLAGDAAMFLDPVFSSGVCLALCQGFDAANHLADIFAGKITPDEARKQYARTLSGTTLWFRRLVKLYYGHSFRELFLHGRGPLSMHRALIALLAGHIFPAPSFKVIWRYRLFELCLKLQRHVALVPRRKEFSLLKGQTV